MPSSKYVGARRAQLVPNGARSLAVVVVAAASFGCTSGDPGHGALTAPWADASFDAAGEVARDASFDAASDGSLDATMSCASGQFRCVGDELQTCHSDASGSAFGAVATCGAGLCDAPNKRCDKCVAGTGSCADGKTLKACGADGQGETTMACPSATPLCVGDPGSARCVGCAKSTDCPASMSECELAACSVAGACGLVPIAKDAPCGGVGSSGKCDGAGRCTVCTPGTAVCSGSSVLTCNALGVYDPPVACASSTPYCDSTTAKCVACTSATQCPTPANPCLSGVCSASACGYAPSAVGATCPTGKCDGAGACLACSPGTAHCSTSTSRAACNAAGQYDPAVTCTGSTPYCEPTTATCVQCTSATQCPTSANPCLMATCGGNACNFAMRPAGSTCPGGTCDGAGACNAKVDAGLDTAGGSCSAACTADSDCTTACASWAGTWCCDPGSAVCFAPSTGTCSGTTYTDGGTGG
jgi:hypothetical protein